MKRRRWSFQTNLHRRKRILIQCGLVAPYGVIDLGQHWLRVCFATWRHQAITWINVDLPSIGSSDIHLMAISQDITQSENTKFCLKITHINFHPNRSHGPLIWIVALTMSSVLFGPEYQCSAWWSIGAIQPWWKRKTTSWNEIRTVFWIIHCGICWSNCKQFLARTKWLTTADVISHPLFLHIGTYCPEWHVHGINLSDVDLHISPFIVSFRVV